MYGTHSSRLILFAEYLQYSIRQKIYTGFPARMKMLIDMSHAGYFSRAFHAGYRFPAFEDRAQKPPDMRTRALATGSCIPAVRFSKWRRTNQNLTRHSGRCQAAVLALRIFQHR